MAPDNDTNETKKKEFGPGLRAQLKSRSDETKETKPAAPQLNVELRSS
jgi:hypothetical protein